MGEDEKVTRLAKPVRKGALSLIFSRFLLIVLLLALQVGLLAAVYLRMSPYIPYLAALQTLFVFAMVVYLFNCTMGNSSKLTWMLIIAALPQAGAALLLFVRTDLGHRVIKRRMAQIVDETLDAIPQPPEAMAALHGDSDGTDDLAHYLSRSGCYPVYAGSQARYFPSGETKLEALMEELEKAEKYIFLEYFILEEGYMWGRVLNTLIEKAAQGVEVRVLYDGMCELQKLPFHYTRLLEARGIKAKIFAPIRPVVSSYFNYRDHRKVLVVDGNVAFTGGVNLADEYINLTHPFGHWKDAALMVTGPAVKSFTLMFLQMWSISEPSVELEPWLSAGGETDPGASGWVMPYADSPLDEDRVGETVYMDILYRATDYVHIMTPYLILDSEMKTALQYAAERGVDVKLILPGIPDKKMAYALAKSQYAPLIESGVQIYEYTPGFVHAKVCVSDDEKAVVGTINLDYRSFYHNYECAVYLYRADCIADIERDFDETLAKCRRVTEETIAHEKLFYKVVGTLTRFIAPLM